MKNNFAHQRHELTEKDFLLTQQCNVWKWVTIGLTEKKSYKKQKERYSKEKAAEYYLQNRETIKEKSKNRYKNLSKEGKDKIKEYQRKRYQQLIQYKKKHYKINEFCFCSV